MACFAKFKKIRDLTEIELNSLRVHCQRGCVKVKEHFLFHGLDGHDYGSTRFTLRGEEFKFRRHLLALSLKLIENGTYDTWGDGLEASHLCHKKRCFNPDHLTLEDHTMNKSRDQCLTQGQCVGHGDAPDCIFVDI